VNLKLDGSLLGGLLSRGGGGLSDRSSLGGGRF
jgi:hypothetical protein